MSHELTLGQRFQELRASLKLRDFLRPTYPVLDALSLPATALGALHFKLLRRFGIVELGRNRELLSRLGIWPIAAHYYEPFVRKQDLRRPLDTPRDLPGLDLNLEGQLEFVATLRYGDELAQIPIEQSSSATFGYSNGTFAFGDAAFYYSVIRKLKPSRLIEIGAGNSTLVARLALDRNATEGSATQHVCVEPYEMPWLERLGIEIRRSKVEEVDRALIDSLGPGDILFVDSSHVIRPQGDVLFLYQEILPRLAPGVFVHVHDVFTPRDYPEDWVLEKMLLWNEQYLLEAFLTFNPRFKVLGALNFLFRDHFEALAEALPILKEHRNRRPMSFWMRRES